MLLVIYKSLFDDMIDTKMKRKLNKLNSFRTKSNSNEKK